MHMQTPAAFSKCFVFAHELLRHPSTAPSLGLSSALRPPPMALLQQSLDLVQTAERHTRIGVSRCGKASCMCLACSEHMWSLIQWPALETLAGCSPAVRSDPYPLANPCAHHINNMHYHTQCNVIASHCTGAGDAHCTQSLFPAQQGEQLLWY